MAAPKKQDEQSAVPDSAADAAGPGPDDAGVPPDGGPAGTAGDTDPGDGTAPGGAAPPDPVAEPSTPGVSAAAPVDAPKPRRRPNPEPSKAVEPNAAMRETPGSHVALVNHDGDELTADDLFTDDGAHRTWLLASQRIYQRFRYPGTQTVTTQLLYPAGARVPRDHAERVKATLRQQAASPAAGELPGIVDLETCDAGNPGACSPCRT